MGSIPERANFFRLKLEQFLRSERMAGFSREGLDRFLGEGREPPEDDQRPAIEYLLFAYRDRSGRKLVDHYLEEKREELGHEERELFTRWREARFSFLQVEEVRKE